MTVAQQFRQEGHQEGRQEGHQEGRQEGHQEGRQEGLQEAIIEALEIRFNSLPAGMRESINGITDLEKLRDLHHTAIRCADLVVFAQALQT